MSTWGCTTCTYINPISRTTCEMCNTKHVVAPTSPVAAPVYTVPMAVPFAASWNCPACTYTNSGTRQRCEMCEGPRTLVGIPVQQAQPLVGIPVRQATQAQIQQAAPAQPNSVSRPSPAPLTQTKSQVIDRTAEVQQQAAVPRKAHASLVYSSWLKKKSPKAVMGRHIWEARYFVLFPDRLLYFRRYDDSFDLTKYAGCIMLADIDSVITLTHNSNSTRYRFNIQLANSDKKFELMADGEEVDKGKKWNVLLLDMLPERGGEKKSAQGKFWKAGAETPPEMGVRRRASSIRRQNVYAGRSSFTGLSAATEKKETMPQEDKDFVLLVMSDTRVALKNLDPPTKEKMLGSMFRRKYQTGENCVKAGESSSLFFIVKSGSFSALKMNNRRTTYGPGTCFGEEDLLSEQASSVTITAMEDSVCWCLERASYKNVLMQSNLGRAAQYLAFLSANRLLSSLGENDLRQLAGALEEAEYGVAEEIVSQGDVGESFYIVKSGECEVIKDGVKVAHYWEGDSFGERALLQNTTRAATVVAVTEVVVLQLDRATFVNLLGPLETIKTKQAKEEKPPELAGYSVGDRLEVQTAKGPQVGTVRYVGYPHFTKRARLGLELDKPMGKHDGHSKGQRYFKCPNKHGVFVASDEVLQVISKVKPPQPKPVAPAAQKTQAKPAGGDLLDLMYSQNAAHPPAQSVQAPSNDAFSALAAKKSPSPSPSPSASPASADPFTAIASGKKAATAAPAAVPVNRVARGNSLSDLFDMRDISSVIAPAQKSGPEVDLLSMMSGPMTWTPPVVGSPGAVAEMKQQPTPSKQAFTPSAFANNFLANLPADLDEKELKTGAKPSPFVQQKTHFSDDEDSDDDAKGKPKAIGPGQASGVDDLLYGRLGLSADGSNKTTQLMSTLGVQPRAQESKQSPPPGSPSKVPPPPSTPSPGSQSPNKPPPPPATNSPPALSSTPAPSPASSAAGEESEEAKMAAHLARLKEIRDRQLASGVSVSMIDKPNRDHKPCRIDQMIEIGELGKGTFGTVKLVTDPNTQLTYALKTIDKAYLIKQNQVEFVKNERLCLSMMDNPFLVKMYAASMDAKSIFFVLEPAMGGELFALLNEKERLPQDFARFYGASIVMAFEYMHSIGIVYRDLKPENILLDDVGYVKLTDFGFAKQLGTSKTFTFCGTPDYLSPEIISNEGHSYGTDWWCLGILIYEMLTGNTPFFDEGGQLAMYDKIINAPVTFPDYVSEAAKDLINSLLAKKEVKRLGVIAGGAALIKQHPFFAGFDWDGLVNRTIPAPYLRPLKNKYDLSHFAEPVREDTEGEPMEGGGLQMHN